MRYGLILLLASLLMSCSDGPSSPGLPLIDVHMTSTSSGKWRDGDEVYAYDGSHVILVKNAPVKIKMYDIKDGVRSLKRTFDVNPAHDLFSSFTVIEDEDTVAIEYFAPYEKVLREDGNIAAVSGAHSDELRFARPYRIGSSPISRSIRPLRVESELIKYVIYEDPDAPGLTVGEYETEAQMLEQSSKRDLRFIVITAEPAAP